jgi:hypothetical protein
MVFAGLPQSDSFHRHRREDVLDFDKEQMQMAQLTSAARRPLWVAVLVLASVVFSLGFACAVPFAAFAAIAALTLSRRDAFALVGAVWLANQIAGFTVHHYPATANALAWGAGLGAVALLSTFAAQWVKDHLAKSHMVAAIAALLAAFAVYEGSLFAISLALANGVSDYAPSIVGRIFAINTAAFAALFLVHRQLEGKPRYSWRVS